ncbi:MAG: MFS transporter [Peptococcaceae bacterium]|jgi:MFS family permease|nr:MFS transporter [Peptococcaceae bacterium]MDH7526299.1 MFS transporter [Peptococcaceae bacterium]
MKKKLLDFESGLFRSFNYRNYRLFFGGQCISLIGTWIQLLAMSWLVYRLTNSALLLGIVGFANELPVFLFTPFAGVLADRWKRHRALLATQTLAMLQALVLAALVLTGRLQTWQIICLGVFLGCVNAFDMPIRQSFIADLVDKKEDLGNAIALNSSMFNAARLVGPSIAGILVSLVGEGLCFLVNGISYFAVIVALLAVKVTGRPAEKRRGGVFQDLKEGFSYAYGFIPIRYILLLLALVSLIGMPYTVLMPVFAKDILGGGPHTLGFLMGATGLGALIGAVYLASQKGLYGVINNIPLAAGVFGAGLVAFSHSTDLRLSLAFLLVSGFGMMVQMASSNTVLQTVVDDNKRGRVMSFYVLSFRGMAPFGSFMTGALADRIGAVNTLLFGGLACLLGAVVYASKLKHLRSVILKAYADKGLA